METGQQLRRPVHAQRRIPASTFRRLPRLKIGAKILMATDPGSDRVGVQVLHDGKFIALNGASRSGALLIDYLYNTRKGTERARKGRPWSRPSSPANWDRRLRGKTA